MTTLSLSTTTCTLLSKTPLMKKTPRFSKPSQLSLVGSSSKITCKADDPKMDRRRNILLGLGGLYLHGAAAAAPTTAAEPVSLPKALGKGFVTKVARPKKSRSKREKIEKEEVLEVTVELGASDNSKYIKFDVYLNDKFDHHMGQTKADIRYAGSFTRLPDLSRGSNKKALLKMPITEIIQDIGADDDDYVFVVFVARTGQEGITIIHVNITFI